MSVLLQRIAELELRLANSQREVREVRRSRDLWKHRALSYGRGGAGRERKKVAA